MIHELKILPEYFKAVKSGEKTFELRKYDRDYRVGDILHLMEWTGKEYTGRTIDKQVVYILNGKEAYRYGLDKKYCILSIKDYMPCGEITDEEIDAFGRFSDDQKEIIKREYRKHPKGFFPNPMCALY